MNDLVGCYLFYYEDQNEWKECDYEFATRNEMFVMQLKNDYP